MKSGLVDSNADGWVNMLHYEDAASVAVEAILKGRGETIYLASDDEPLTREAICRAGVESGISSLVSSPCILIHAIRPFSASGNAQI